MKKEEMTSIYKTKIDHIANNILKSSQLNLSLKPSFLSLMTFKIQQLYYKKDQDNNSLDYLYWKNNGWLEQTCFYYIETKSKLLKVIFARFLGTIIARIALK